MSENLGKASLDLEANLAPFEKNMQAGKRTADDMQDALDAIAKVAIVAEIELNKVKMEAAAGAKSREVADTIERSVGRVGRVAMEASSHLEKVKLDASNASETTVAADVIDRKLKDVTGNANEARRALESVRLAGAGAAGAGGGNPGAGIGPFGSGFGRMGILGAAIAGGTLLGPAAGPGALGLLAAIPVLATTGAGALGTLALAFQGVGKAISGDKKAFDGLEESQKKFVLTVRSLDDAFDKLKQTAASSLFPGLTAGLKAALSPGTMNAITQAVTEFGHAIGQAGLQWGKYFGSAEFQSIFGPLMQAGARNLTLMSTAALALFDAMGVLARAAIPFTGWLMQAIVNGSKLADTWMHAKDASGGLSRAMNEAQVSLRLVGDLLLSVGRAIGALGVALYPVSKIAVKDLTNGFNALALIIKHNQESIREIVSGALAALVSTVKALTPIVTTLAHVLDDVAHAVGGWKVAFEIILAGFLVAKIAAAVSALAAMTVGVEALGLAISALPLAGIVIPIVLAITYRKQISDAISGISDSILNGLGVNTTRGGLPTYDQWKNSKGSERLAIESAMKAGGVTSPANLPGGPGSYSAGGAGSEAAAKAAHGMAAVKDAAQVFIGKSIAGESSTLIAALQGLSQQYDNAKINVISGYRSTAKQQALWDASVQAGHPGRMPNGNPIAKPGTSPHESGSALDGQIMIGGKWVPLSSLPPSVLAKYGLSTVAGDVNHVQLASLNAAAGATSPFGDQPAWSKNVPGAPKQPTIVTGANLIPQAINDRIAKFANIAQNSAGKVAEAALEKEQKALLDARDAVTAKLKGATGQQRAEITSELTDLNGKLRDVHTAIKDNLAAQRKAVEDAIKAVKSRYSGQISTLKGNVAAMFSRIQADLDAALQAKFQQQIAALGKQFFQGGMTPSEALLAQMQTEDTKKSLADALTQARAQFAADQAQGAQAITDAQNAFNAAQAAKDAATEADAATKQELQTALNNARAQLNSVINRGNSPEQLRVDEEAITQAQRAIDENAIAIAATQERAEADRQYAERLAELQHQQTLEQQKLTDELARFSARVQNGTANLGDLNQILAPFGLSIADIPADQLGYDMDNLSTATQTLAQVMLAEAVALAKLGDSKDAKRLGATAQSLLDNGFSELTDAGWNAGIAAALAAPHDSSDVISRLMGRLPKLDVGGHIAETGIAVVHQGEDYLGTGANRRSGIRDVHLYAGTVIGGDLPQVARELKPHLDRAIELKY